MKSIKFLFIITGIVLLNSCQSNTYDEISEKTIVDAGKIPTYTTDFKPVLESKCIGCHSQNGGQSPYLNDYESVKKASNPQSGNLLCKINGDASCGAVMPPSAKLPQATISVIEKWTQTGYTK